MPERLTHEKQYLVWMDILGFEQLATEIEEKKGIEARKVRTDFREVISDRVKTVEDNGLILGKNEESDDWLIVTDSLNKVFELIHEVLNHSTGYTDYPTIPLEIAIDTREYNRLANFQGSNLVGEDSTIQFLKTYICDHYRAWYRDCHGSSIKSTFIVLTESAYQDLRPLDKKTCQQIRREYEQHGVKKVREFFVADVDKFLLRGKGLKFSKEIGYPDDEDYSRIYDLYVPSVGYKDIEKTLEEKRIVFITGTPEYGKTYTAVRLMWDYYTQGYEPVWHKGGEEGQRTDVRERLQRIESELRPGQIIYFEDPFGKIEYERREWLEREIGVIVKRVEQVNGAFVIITSREEVFKQFEREKLSKTDLKEFEQKLNLKRPSYDAKKRKEILLRRAEKEGCVWLGDTSLEKFILEEVEREKLPTTMNIRDFAIASTNVKKKNNLMQLIQAKSEETAMVFAREIMEMREDKQLFLTFPLIGYISLDDAREAYRELVERCGTQHPWSFEDVLKWFEGDKIRISKGGQPSRAFIQLSHQSYSEALDYLLEGDDGFKGIFSLSMSNLSERESSTWAVALAVAKNFNRLPGEVQDLLFRLSGRELSAGNVAWAVAGNFDRLPGEVRNQLLLKLSERESSTMAVAWAVAKNFNRLPGEVQDLLFKLSGRKSSAWAVAFAVVGNFDRLPGEVKNLLQGLLERDAVAMFLVMLFKFLGEEERRRLLSKLPEEARRKLALIESVNPKLKDLSEEWIRDSSLRSE